MILLSDSGSTKTDWCVVDKGQVVRRIATKGINPFYQTEDEVAEEIGENLLPSLEELKISAVWFYGAGCAFPEKNEIIRRAINRYVSAPVSVGSDMLAAARSLCGNKPGIACILGTGSNSCFYTGEGIGKNVSPLGLLLGDEGSGAVLGKLLVGDLLKGLLSPGLTKQFYTEFTHLTPEVIMDRVYRQPFPNRFLATLSPFLLQHIEESAIYDLVSGSFRAFFTRNVMQYDYVVYPVHMVGSVAFYYQEIIRKVAAELNIRIGTIEQSPMSGLIAYHMECK